MKLAVLYSVFNGLELLSKSMEQVYDHVDLVVICYQNRSNTGNYSTEVEPFVERFRGRKKVEIIHFEPDLALNTKENERRKLQLRLDFAKKQGITHYFSAATDHFYRPEEVILAKEMVQTHDWDVTFTAMYTYFKLPTWQITPIEDYYMPFICKLYPHSKIERVSGFPLRVDPSVQVNTWRKWYLFKQDEVMLHHYSMIRQDIRNKFNNAAASIRWKPDAIQRFVDEYENYDLATNPGISYFGGRKVKVVEDWFGLLNPVLPDRVK